MSDKSDGPFSAGAVPGTYNTPSGGAVWHPSGLENYTQWIVSALNSAYRIGRDDERKAMEAEKPKPGHWEWEPGKVTIAADSKPPTVTRKFIGGPLDGQERTLGADTRIYAHSPVFVDSKATQSGVRIEYDTTEFYKLGTVNGEAMMVHKRWGK